MPSPASHSLTPYERVLGCLWGTALGDAAGLAREGLSRRRAERLFGPRPIAPSLVFGRGWCSDDTEHTQLVGRALVIAEGDVERFERELIRGLRWWILTLPPGTGLATLRACLRLLVRISPPGSGIFSAGNGPAMRSALIGLCAPDPGSLEHLVRTSTRITHTDPKAEEGALMVARAARWAIDAPELAPIEFCTHLLPEVQGDELRDHLAAIPVALREGLSPEDFANSRGWTTGISGYINQTVPAAIYCWGYAPDDFRSCITSAVRLGGDTDSVAAIAGAIWGANQGSVKLPMEWLAQLAEWPRGATWMEQLAAVVAHPANSPGRPPLPRLQWEKTLVRNLGFGATVVALALRRLLPPY